MPVEREARTLALPKERVRRGRPRQDGGRNRQSASRRADLACSLSQYVIGSSGWRRRIGGEEVPILGLDEAVYPCGEGDLVDPEELDGMDWDEMRNLFS